MCSAHPFPPACIPVQAEVEAAAARERKQRRQKEAAQRMAEEEAAKVRCWSSCRGGFGPLLRSHPTRVSVSAPTPQKRREEKRRRAEEEEALALKKQEEKVRRLDRAGAGGGVAISADQAAIITLDQPAGAGGGQCRQYAGGHGGQGCG